jgi:glycosyltransferase involved in cell wall biosynthesis
MKIGIDARIFGIKEAGLGRYTQKLIKSLAKTDKQNQYILFFRKESFDKFKTKNPKFKKVLAEICHYTFKEQILIPPLIRREKVDLMHFLHFNVPVFNFGPYVVTIHDLIKHEYRGAETTTRGPIFYWLKYIFYLLVVWWVVKRAQKIIVPSNWVKEKLVKNFKLSPEKVVVIYEGVEKSFQFSTFDFQSQKKVLEKYKIGKPYLIYVGSVYPHKNVERLIGAVQKINQSSVISHQSSVVLVIVCGRNVFLERLKVKIGKRSSRKEVNLVGFVPDDDLIVLYQNALAFVSPSLSEGFGLPGLEAMAVGIPVVCSNIPVFREIYGEAVTYFDPYDIDDIARGILEVLSFDTLEYQGKVEEGLKQARRFSWEECAKKTLKVYEEVLGGR